jgi:hypothetical protein
MSTILLITLNQRWHQRRQRTLPLSVTYASQYFERLWIVDASTLEALFRKLKTHGSLKSKMVRKIKTVKSSNGNCLRNWSQSGTN